MTPAAPFDTRLLGSGALAFLAVGALPALIGAALPAWAPAFGLGQGEGGTAVALINAGAVTTVLLGIAGVPGLTLRPALALLALGAAGIALAGAWGAILASAFVAGLGYGILAVTVNRRVLHGFGARGPGMVGLVNGVFGLGAIAAPLLYLVAGQAVAWAVVAAALASLVLATPEPGPRPPTGLPRLRRVDAGLLFLNMGSVVIENVLIALATPALVARGTSPEAAAAWLAAFFGTYVAARLSLVVVAARVAPQALFSGAVVGMTACMALAATVSAPVGFVLAGAFVGISFPAFFVWSARALGTDARINAVVLLSGLTGAALGPVLVRPILAVTGDGGLFAVMATLGAALTLCLALFGARLSRVTAPAAMSPA